MQFVPNEGFVIDAVTVKVGAGAATPVVVFSDTYDIAAVVDNTTVEVTYKKGVTPPVITHAITPSPCTNGSISPASVQTVPHAGTASFVVQADDMYVIDAITVDGTPVATQATGKAAFTYELENVVGDHTIAATFKADARATVTITANSGTNGKISPAGDRVLYKGDPATYYLYPDTGYELGAVSLATTGATGPATDITSQVKGGVLVLTAAQTAASATLDASFKKSAQPDLPEGDKDTYYALTAVAHENGSISPAGTTRVKAGSSQTFYFTPNEGFTVDTVKANGKVVDFAGLSYTLPDVRCNTTLEVFYRALGGGETPPLVPVMHTLTAQAGKGGSVSPAPTVVVPEGGSMPITIAPESDYAVATISVDGTPVYTAPGKSAAAASVLDALGAALFGAEPLAQTPPAAYLFENVKADHTLAVTFAYKGTAPEPSYHQIDARVEGGNGTITPQGVSKVADKGAQTFSFVPASGYVVDQVRVNGTLAPGPVTGNYYTVSNIRADTSVVVSFKPQSGAVDPTTYTISATTSAGGAISPAGDSAVVAGASLGYMFTPSTGYELSGVLVDGTANADALAKGSYTFTNVTGPHTIKALFKATGTTPGDPTDPDKKFVTLSTNANKGGSITPANPQVAVGSTAEFRVLPDRGFELKSLLLDGAEVKDQLVGGKLTLENVLVAHTLAATFSALPTPPADEFRSVTATAGANGKISPAGAVQVKLGATQTFTFAPDAGFVVDQVTVDGTPVPNTANVSDYALVNIQKNSKIDVSFRAKKTTDPDPAATHTIKATATGGGSISPAGDVLVADKGTAQFAFTPDDGYELTALSVGGTPVLDPVPSGYTFNNVVADSSIAATFAKKAPVTQKFNLSTEVVGGNGRVAPAGTTSVVAHTAQTVYCYPDAGFAVSSVMVTAGTGAPVEMLGSLVGGTALTIDDFTMDTKVAVSFDKGTTPDVSTYKVKASATKGGTISPEGETTVTKGGSLAFALTAQAGYHLQHIVLTRGTSTPLTVPVSGASYTLGNVTSDCSVQAVYAAVPEPPASYYTVNASVAAAADGSKGGSISPEGSVRVASGNVQTFYFTPNSGQVVDKVLVDGTEVAAGVLSYTLPAVTKDTTLTVSFVAGTTPPLPTQYPLTATATAGGSISPRGETQVHQGGQLLYTFAAEEGYTLTKVEVDGGSAKGGSDLSAEQLAQGFYRFVGVNAAHTIHATFTADAPVVPEARYSVSASVDATGGGSVSPAQTDNIAAGTPVVFTFVPAADKVVSSITLTKNGQAPGTTFDYSANSYTLTGIDANTQLVVAFADKPGTKPPATHKVNVSVSGTGGTITPRGDNLVLHNGALLLSVAPDATPGAAKQLDTLKVTRNGVTTDVAAQVKN
ncbi:hypothetical protein, partial [Comamonas sp.]|uniref:hypothetical protein n=1 Tax=Comamonas sp. TaxID=34028 RepID=UPI002FCA9873